MSTNPSINATRLTELLFSVFPEGKIGNGTSIDESVVVDNYGSPVEMRRAKSKDPTAKLSWRQLIGDPRLLAGLNAGLGGYNFMNDRGKQFYIPAALATLLAQPQLDYHQCFLLAYQFESNHAPPQFSFAQYSVVLQCMEYFLPLTDDSEGPVAECCKYLRSMLRDWPIENRSLP